ncbi:hypothetical protein [Deinococcus ruber]|nr:hypothetical protein [Deinococcus ruber]
MPDPFSHTDRAGDERGFRPCAAEATIVEIAASLRDLGLSQTQE